MPLGLKMGWWPFPRFAPRWWPLFGKELYGYLATPVAYFFLFAFWVMAPLLTFELGGLFERNQADLDPFFTDHPWLYLFFLPALTMRLWAEEWRGGTAELLLTLPVTTSDAILGKFFASWAFVALALLGTFPLWVTVNLLGDPDNGAIVAAYLGSFLMAGSYLALGMVFSALTRNQIVAFLSAASVSFLFTVSGTPLLLDLIARWAPGWLVDAIAAVSFQTHFQGIARGVLVAGDLLFFLVLMGGGLWMTRLAIGCRRGGWVAARWRFVRVPILTLMVSALVGQLTYLRIDLTEEKRHTLSRGSLKILAKLKTPVVVKLFFSEEATREMPFLRAYFQRVREFLELYPRASDRVRLQVIDPEPFSREEEEAIALGLKPVQLTPSAPEVIFGIAVVRGERKAVIPFLSRDQEPFLEYLLDERIIQVSRDRPPAIALYADPDLLVRGGIDPVTRKFQPPWVAVENLFRLYRVEMLPQPFRQIGDVDLLLLIHPQDLPEESLRAIDRYLTHGGRALIFVDPYAERDGPPRFVDPKRHKASNLNRLFRAYGFEQIEGKFLADDRYAVRVQIGNGRPVRHLAFLGLEGEAFGDHPAVARLRKLYVSSIGAFRKFRSQTEWRVLLSSSPRSMLMPTVALDYLFNPLILRDAFKPSGKRYPLAIFLQTHLPSAFGAEKGPTGNSERGQPARLLVVADTDLLANTLWSHVEKGPDGSVHFLPFADNGAFLINAVDFLVGDPDLIEVRSKRRLLRPFRVVEEKRREIERQLEAKRLQLRKLLQETEERLTQLRKSPEAAAQATSEQKRLEKRRRELQRELRRLRYQLSEEIEALGRRLKLLNIVVAPILFTLLIALLGQLWIRRRAL